MLRIQQRRAMHLPGQADRPDLTEIVLLMQRLQCAVGRLPPAVCVLLAPQRLRTRNGQLLRLAGDHLACCVQQHHLNAGGA